MVPLYDFYQMTSLLFYLNVSPLKVCQYSHRYTISQRHFANAIKAMGKGNQKAVESSVAYKALMRIGAIYKLEESLKTLSLKERLKERQSSIRPLVEEYFAWVKEVLASGTVLTKSETAKGLNYSINQEEYLKVFLTDGEVPIDELIKTKI